MNVMGSISSNVLAVQQPTERPVEHLPSSGLRTCILAGLTGAIGGLIAGSALGLAGSALGLADNVYNLVSGITAMFTG